MSIEVAEFERPYDTAHALWAALSPTRDLFPRPHSPIFRGQADARWDLVPAVLRKRKEAPTVGEVMGGAETADVHVFFENLLLSQFCQQCDRYGVRVPGDSIRLRETLAKTDPYLLRPNEWPNPELFEVMAFAQHHGIPTRLLDWSESPYVAIYFAVETALKSYKEWTDEWRLAIWVVNMETIGLYSKRVQIVRVPGSVSSNRAAQAGLFTVQKVGGSRGRSMELQSLQDEFTSAGSRDILKLTVPVKECVHLYDLCDRVGVSAASLFPGADGAARAVHDRIRAACARQWLIDNGCWR